MDSDSVEEINSKTQALTAAFQKVSEQIYAAAQEEAASADGGSADEAGDEEEVVDAEVVDEGEEQMSEDASSRRPRREEQGAARGRREAELRDQLASLERRSAMSTSSWRSEPGRLRELPQADGG